MPDSPHATPWHEAVLRYGFNTISSPADKTSQAPADGKKIGDWVTTAQVYPDFTLENHGIFHPVYSMIGPATRAQAAVASHGPGRSPPRPDTGCGRKRTLGWRKHQIIWSNSISLLSG